MPVATLNLCVVKSTACGLQGGRGSHLDAPGASGSHIRHHGIPQVKVEKILMDSGIFGSTQCTDMLSGSLLTLTTVW